VRTFWSARCCSCGRRVKASGPPSGWTCARHAPALAGARTEAERTREALDVALDQLGAPELRRLLELAARLVPTPPGPRPSRMLVQVQIDHGNGERWRCAGCDEVISGQNDACKCKGWEVPR
jgi:hypothetical protein